MNAKWRATLAEIKREQRRVMRGWALAWRQHVATLGADSGSAMCLHNAVCWRDLANKPGSAA